MKSSIINKHSRLMAQIWNRFGTFDKSELIKNDSKLVQSWFKNLKEYEEAIKKDKVQKKI